MSESAEQPLPWKGWRDDPIKTVEEDRLRRAPVARRAAQLIAENHSAGSSVVYGREGPWGSGKSSVISLLTSYLIEAQDSHWKVVTFTPWATTGTEGLLSEFFAALATVAPTKKGDKVRGLMASYADIARPFASLIPFAGAAVVEASRTLEHRLAKPWSVAFDEIAGALRELDTPVLVVVDDIDRLQPSELLDLLKVVRLLGRFPGVDFLLAYDEQTLVETLQSPARGTASKARARAFMEKIVQYPLTIPPLLTSQIVRMLDTGLTDILTVERVETGFDKHRFGDVILTTMPRQLTTPRAVERFLAQVREQFRAHDLDEMNDVDLILATFLRVQFPDVFAKLQSRKADLTKVTSSNFGSNREEREPDWHALVSVLDQAEDRHDALSVLGAIFPATRGKNPSRVAARRFAHPDYFDRYLAQAIPEGDIPDSLISQLLEKAAAGNADDLRALFADADNDRVMLGLSKIRERYPDVDEVNYHTGPKGPITLELLTVAMALVAEANDDRLSTFTSTSDQLRWWAANLLRRLLSADPTHDVDSALLGCNQIHRRTHVLTTATRDMSQLSAATQNALTEALQREVGRILPMLLADLRTGDNSNGETGSSFLYELVAESERLGELQKQIAEGLAANDFTIEDVAARFVGLAYVIGGSGNPSSASFMGDLFTKVTGVPSRSADHVETGEWSDTGWPRRREFAVQFINPRGTGDQVEASSDEKDAHQ